MASKKSYGPASDETLRSAFNLSNTLLKTRMMEKPHFGKCPHAAEAKSLLRDALPVARSTFGADHYLTLNIQGNCALALIHDLNATKNDAIITVTDFLDETIPAKKMTIFEHTVYIAH